MKRKIYIKLIGGLGNQLFQYSCAKNLSIELNADLIVDDITGFIFDRSFKRKKTLPKNLDYHKINFLDIFIFNLIILIKKIFFKKKIFLKFYSNMFVDETKSNKFLKNLPHTFKEYKRIYMIGFFQSEKYFLENKNEIVNKILKNKISNHKIKKIKSKISKKSIFVGIRMFEEAHLNIRQNFGGIESYSFYNNKIKIYKKLIKNPKFMIFSTLNKKKINKNIVENCEIVDNKNLSNSDDFEYLLLISNFSNFIISNSSYYWWGALLAENNKKINILASKKFLDINTVPSRWNC